MKEQEEKTKSKYVTPHVELPPGLEEYGFTVPYLPHPHKIDSEDSSATSQYVTRTELPSLDERMENRMAGNNTQIHVVLQEILKKTHKP